MTVSGERETTSVDPDSTDVADPADHDSPPLITFPSGFPGFSAARTWTLDQLDETGTVFALRNVEDPTLRFIVVPPGRFFPGYAPAIDEAASAEIGLDGTDDALILVVITPGERVEESTGNLLAPVVVNARTRVGAQVVLSGSDHPLRALLGG